MEQDNMSDVSESLADGAATVAGVSSNVGAQAPLATAVAAVSGDGVSSPCDHQPVGDQGEARCEIESQPMADTGRGPEMMTAPVAAGADERAATRETGNEEDIFAKLGEPFPVDEETGKVDLNQRAAATAFTHTRTIQYDSLLREFFHFDEVQGLWVPESAERTHQEMTKYLGELGERKKHEQFVQRQKEGTINSLIKFAKANDVKPTVTDTGGLFHAANGVLDLRNDLPVLRPHSRDFPFRKSSGITYDPKAQCPRFLRELLEPALDKDDRDLLQTLFGGMLLGENQAQKIVLIRGTAGGGKSTVVSVLEEILGKHLVAHLRPKNLNGRFEAAGFIDRRVLVGKDVPADTLSEKGAHMLKGLTGGDFMEGEFKGIQQRQQMKGFFHVVIVSNNHLRIKLDGDKKAWGRRLVILDFNREMPKKAIVNFAETLVAAEGPGILNWMVEGAVRYRAQLQDGAGAGRIVMTEAQTQRVDNLLGNSDSVTAFVDRHLQLTPGKDVSSNEVASAYFSRCTANGWQPVSTRKCQETIAEQLASRHNIFPRHDILRPGKKPVRGFKGIAVV